tara:strand:- start:74 stop:436 length:363 start_codon:yes stop_codon:yes gene_type:complete
MPTFTEFKESKPMKDQQVADVLRYSEMLCEALLLDINKNHRDSGYKFYIESGRKYHKLIMETESRNRSVHAFIDKRYGHVYKPASFKAPAKHIRYNLLVDNSREECFARADWAGGYLYLK